MDEPGYGWQAEIGSDLQRLTGRSEVDVTILNGAGPVLYHRVLRDGVRLFARDLAATTTREGSALSRYCDYLPTLRAIESLHRARTSSGDFGR